jgi:hypothetical protein
MPLLFSYGTLQHPSVQMSTFGRHLRGERDELVVTVADPAFVATSGKADHAIVRFNGHQDSRVAGTAFEVTEAELIQSDEYEPAGYVRTLATLASGRQAWVYAAVGVEGH